MKLIALRFIFKGKGSYGKPQGEGIHVMEKEYNHLVVEEDGYWEIKTHDRGEDVGESSREYFQIAFRLQGTSEEKASHEVLVSRGSVNNILYYDKDSDLWYERTEFDERGKPKKSKVNRVDSISKSGVFDVVVKNINNQDFILKKQIQVMPSSITKIEYQKMLDKLIDISSKLVVETSSIGIGKLKRDNSTSLFKSKSELDYKLWEKLKYLIKVIKSTPSDLLKKEYKRINKKKVKHFDSHVLCSHFKNTGSIYLDGIVYSMNYDSYENRVIKTLLKKLSSRSIATNTKLYDETEVDELALKDVKEKFGKGVGENLLKDLPVKNVEEDSSNSNEEFELKINTEHKPSTKGNIRNLCMKVKYENGKYTVETNWKNYNHYPFIYKEVVCSIALCTRYVVEVINFISIMSKLYLKIDNGEYIEDYKLPVTIIGEGRLFPVEFDYYSGDYGIYKIYRLNLSSLKSIKSLLIDDITFDNIDGLKLYEYYLKLMSIRVRDGHDYFTICDSRINGKNAELVDYFIGRYSYYINENKEINELKLQNNIINEMRDVINDRWFDNIQELQNIELPVKLTPKFLYNRYYHATYEILQNYFNLYPLLTSDFDTNAFGVKETWQIYEYWVFIELLNRFSNLGFKVLSESISINDALLNFLRKNECIEGACFLLNKEYKVEGENHNVEILFGYNCIVGDQEEHVGKYFKPDYFIRVKRGEECHWYFLDAKYKTYEKKSQNATSFNLEKEIENVAIVKYIYSMENDKLLDHMTKQKSKYDPKNWIVNNENIIKGSYIIAANINDKGYNLISDNDRLYGGDKNPFPEYFNELPMHRYGAIQFRPGFEDELTTLLEMIFEYKETEDTKFCDGSLPEQLHLCWNSSVNHKDIAMPQIDIRTTLGGKSKFVVLCDCGSIVYMTHCLNGHRIVKHTMSNYHKIKSEGNGSIFICPKCGDILSKEDGE